ncbi:MAG: F0F1 ATP synthase subunit gamma [Desulfobacterales bacterium]|nr:F0F1 ATP synthase subunit gamma [Desulfobacterales bacterium]
MGGGTATLRALIREYLFVSLFRACAESLASENASRLAAMQRADKNIDELLEDLNGTFHRLRQSGIDEELFDVISGFEALASGGDARGRQEARTGLRRFGTRRGRAARCAWWVRRRVTRRPQRGLQWTPMFEVAALPMLLLIGVLAMGLGVLAASARAFTTTAERVGLLLGLSPFAVGVIMVAVGTSLPELAASILAASRGTSEVVSGNVVGANTANLLLVLGCVAVVSRRGIQLGERYIAIDLNFMAGSGAILTLVMYDGGISRLEGALAAGGLCRACRPPADGWAHGQRRCRLRRRPRQAGPSPRTGERRGGAGPAGGGDRRRRPVHPGRTAGAGRPARDLHSLGVGDHPLARHDAARDGRQRDRRPARPRGNGGGQHPRLMRLQRPGRHRRRPRWSAASRCLAT